MEMSRAPLAPFFSLGKGQGEPSFGNADHMMRKVHFKTGFCVFVVMAINSKGVFYNYLAQPF